MDQAHKHGNSGEQNLSNASAEQGNQTVTWEQLEFHTCAVFLLSEHLQRAGLSGRPFYLKKNNSIFEGGENIYDA